MRPLKPLFRRSASKDELERDAERLKNRDWVEILQVIHPSQAEAAQKEYLLSRLKSDWAELAGPLLASHTQPSDLYGAALLVLCDHNTFANELAMLSNVIERKITGRYSITVRIQARATQKINWQKADSVQPKKPPQVTAETKPAKPTVVDRLIDELTALERRENSRP